MDQRIHERVAVDLEARIIDLSGMVEPQDGRFIDASKAGICVLVSSPLAVGDVVRVDFSEGCLFGQVVYTTRQAAVFRTGIEIFTVLLGGSDLARMIEQTLEQKERRCALMPARSDAGEG